MRKNNERLLKYGSEEIPQDRKRKGILQMVVYNKFLVKLLN